MEPDAICNACGAAGTVGRVFRRSANGTPLGTHRFCLACWPSESDRVTAQWEQEQAALSSAASYQEGSADSIHWESATWDNAVFLVTGIEAELQSAESKHESDTLESLVQIADELATIAPQMVQPVPELITSFIQRYRVQSK